MSVFAIDSSPPLDRRTFIRSCAAVAACGVAGCASVVTRPIPVEGGRLRLSLRDFPALTTPGGVARVAPAGTSDVLYVVALPDRQFSVVSSRCTHRGCTIDRAGDHFACPCHGSMFDNEGRVVRGPAERTLDRYRATLADDAIVVSLGTTP